MSFDREALQRTKANWRTELEGGTRLFSYKALKDAYSYYLSAVSLVEGVEDELLNEFLWTVTPWEVPDELIFDTVSAKVEHIYNFAGYSGTWCTKDQLIDRITLIWT